MTDKPERQVPDLLVAIFSRELEERWAGKDVVLDDFLHVSGGNGTRTHFSNAASTGQLQAVRNILPLEERLTVQQCKDAVNSDSDDFLMQAAKHKELGVLPSLLAEGESVTADDFLRQIEGGYTPLRYALCNDQDAEMRTLLGDQKFPAEAFTVPQKIGEHVLPLLVCLAEKNRLSQLHSWLKDGELIPEEALEERSVGQKTVYHLAAETGSIADIPLITGKQVNREKLFLTSPGGETVIHRAMRNHKLADLNAALPKGQKLTYADLLKKTETWTDFSKENVFYDKEAKVFQDLLKANVMTLKAVNSYWQAAPDRYKENPAGKAAYNKAQGILRRKASLAFSPSKHKIGCVGVQNNR